VNELGSQLGLKTEHGCISVNDKFETSLKDVYALGDCIGKVQLAHYASACAVSLIDSFYGKDNNDLNTVPNCIYTSPEIAYVGKTEEQLKEGQIEYKVGKYPMGGNAKTVIESSGYGFIKVISSLEGQILGASILSERASDIINIFTLAISKKMTISDLESIIYPHPTFGEGIKEALEDTDKKAIHLLYR
jgi:dihydrolipoamide dehydrogenase